MPGISLPDNPTRVVAALAVSFWALVILFLPVSYLLPEAYLAVPLVAFVPTWLAVVALWLRRTRGNSDNIWGAVSQSQASGRYAESGGTTVAEQRDALSDFSDDEE